MYWLTIGMLGTTVAEPLFAVELTDFELVRPNDGELRFTDVLMAVFVADVAAFELKGKFNIC